MKSPPTYSQVPLDVPVFSALTYSVPDELADELQVGHLVQVPFRNQSKTGLITSLDDHLDDPELATKIKPVLDLIDPEPLLSATDVRFLRFVADYYYSPLGEVVRLAIPAAARLDGMKHYQLTDTPPADDLDDDLRAILDLLASGEPHSVRDLRAARPELTFRRLAILEEQGIVDVHYREEERHRPKTETHYRLLRQPEDGERVGATQAQLIALLQDRRGEASITELRDVVDSPWSSLKGLEKRGFLESWEEEVYRDPFAEAQVTEPGDFEFTADQKRALASLEDARQSGGFQTFVLHGVTGSGKTEVYVQTIRKVLASGRRALILLPEIALTPQFVAVFRGHFGDAIAVLHSGLSPAQKFDQWRRIKRDEVDIVIGARSAIFAPIRDLGIIVVDEEHDTSFKQERGTRYNARDMAMVRGKLEDALVVLGSATPILESFHNAQTGRLTYLELPDRVADRPLPEVQIVDMRNRDTAFEPRSSVLSRPLLAAIDDTLKAEKQAILFLNRRGFSPCVLCESCGHLFRCPNCDVSLTYHRRMEALRCHHCDFSLRMPETCPSCEHPGLGRKGTGTEKLEAHLQELYPRARVARLDRDTSSGKGLQRILQAFRKRRIDLLVGTQMVTKGHDFPHVTLVGVVLADMSLNFPDFRSAERTFQLLTQVAGRAGRADSPGEVFIQTYDPDHYSLLAAKDHDYARFADEELQARQRFEYPPFAHLVAVKFEGASESATISAARHYATQARRLFRGVPDFADAITMLGPAMAPIARIKNRSRWQILFKAADRSLLRRFTASLLDLTDHLTPGSSRSRVRIIIDVDPQSLL